MPTIRRKAKIVKIGKVAIGGNNPIAVQSMLKCKTGDVRAAVRQIKQLEGLGCDIVRVAVKDSNDAGALRKIKAHSGIPLVADIHFDWRLALEAIDSGADKIRLNPGNIFKKEQIRQIAKAAKLKDIPIRVGVNSGSLPRLRVKGGDTADKMVRLALDYIKTLEDFGFDDIVVSLKASNVRDTLKAYRKISRLCDYPLHLGVTATGIPKAGVIKSAILIGTLLLEGIGDTIRISLTDEPQEEVAAARSILKAVGLNGLGPEVISCPTCGRCEVDLLQAVRELERKLSSLSSDQRTHRLKVAVMGCEVNGPGEAAEADIGVAFGKKEGLLFKKGRVLRKISLRDCTDTLLREIKSFNLSKT